MDNKKIIIFTDKNSYIGSGHFHRSMNLKKNLLKIKFNTKLIVHTEKISSYIRASKYLENIDLAILDTPIDNSILFRAFRNCNTKTIAFDWFGNFIPDYNVVIFPHKKIKYKKRKFVGLEFINIRDEFLLKKQNKINNKALVTIGTSDKKNQGQEIYTMLKDKNVPVNVLKGKFTKYKNKINKDFISFKNKNFSKLLNNYSYIISSGGSTLFEANYLNKNIFVIPQTIQEKRIASLFLSRKAILGHSKKNIYNFDFDKSNRLICKKIVDGKGILRIMNIIKKIIK